MQHICDNGAHDWYSMMHYLVWLASNHLLMLGAGAPDILLHHALFVTLQTHAL